MVYLRTAEEWQQQTLLLLQARPTTTKITTKYNIPNPDSPAFKKKLAKRKRGGEQEKKETALASEAQVATLTLKTYDPTSGVVLKFQTDKAADVGRLVNSLGRAGRHMAALPEKQDASDIVMENVSAAENRTAATETSAPAANDVKPQQGTGGGKKKKGKSKK